MPEMGESVTEGTVLEWHKHEGEPVSAAETIVEISTDKVDAEVPAPAAGVLTKIHAPEGETIGVGSLLAEISTNGAAQADGAAHTDGAVHADGAAQTATEPVETATAPAPAPPSTVADDGHQAGGEVVDVVTPAAGESVTEGTILEWHRKVGEHIKADETIVEISTDKVDVELPAPATGIVTELLAEEGATVGVGQVIARIALSEHAPPPTQAAPTEPPSSPQGAPEGTPVSPVAARAASVNGVDLSQVQGSGPAGRIMKADVLAAADGSPTTAPVAPPAEARAAGGAAGRAARRGCRARALHGELALGANRNEFPHDRRHRARRAPKGAQGGRDARLLHPPHRLRDRARGL